MSKKFPKHLEPLQNELTATYKDGVFQTETGLTFKTAKEAVAHNNTVHKYLEGFLPSSNKPFVKTLNNLQKKKPKTVASPKDQHLFNLNFQDELNGIRAGLKQIEENRQTLQEIKQRRAFEDNRRAFFETPKKRTSSGLNYLQGLDDE